MDRDLEQFIKFVESQTNDKGEIPSFIGEWASSFITENNAEDLIQFLISINGGSLETFCDSINSAPITDSEWEKSYIVGPGVPDSEEKQAKYRAQRKKIVSIVRNTQAFSKYAASNT
jgi:predicted glycosyltransferase